MVRLVEAYFTEVEGTGNTMNRIFLHTIVALVSFSNLCVIAKGDENRLLFRQSNILRLRDTEGATTERVTSTSIPKFKPDKALPNVVFIFADDMGYGEIQALNPKRSKIPTPSLNQLAAEGMVLYRCPYEFVSMHAVAVFLADWSIQLAHSLTARSGWRRRRAFDYRKSNDPGHAVSAAGVTAPLSWASGTSTITTSFRKA